MEKKNFVEMIKEYPQIVLRPLGFGLAGLAVFVLAHFQSPQYNSHNHQPVRIERTLSDYNQDGRYDTGIIKMTFKDGCVQEENIPSYMTGKTRKEYEEIFNRIDHLDTLQEIEEITTFK